MFFFHRKRRSASRMHHHLESEVTQDRAFLEFTRKLEWIPSLAHHPTCHHHAHHLIWVGRLPLCLGCTMMTSGIIAGILLLFQLDILTTLPFQYLLSIGVLLYFPAIAQIWIQRKPYKLIARFLLGISVVFLMYAGLWLIPWSVVGWGMRLGFLIIFRTVWKLTLKLRSRNSRSPCNHCPDGRFPVCAYTAPRIPKLAEQYFAQSRHCNPEADEFVRALQTVHTNQNR
jgi:hypothetical protein